MTSAPRAGAKDEGLSRQYSSAVDRWASVGPYFAMFPVSMAFDVIGRFTAPGDRVLDPFLGRGSSVFAAGALGRVGCGVEINPVGWLYSSVKLRPAAQWRVERRLDEILRIAGRSRASGRSLHPFFLQAYSLNVLRFLLTARKHLRWRDRHVDRTLMAFLLIYLHGKRGAALSNQLRDSKAMAPDYAVRWWEERGIGPPDVDVGEFMTARIQWRYKWGRPKLVGEAILGDSLKVLGSRRSRVALSEPFDMLFTSPPYRGITNYHYDQWLRLWLLGWPPSPARCGGQWQGKFEGGDDYRALIEGVFAAASNRLKPNAIVYVRTDARQFTLDTTIRALEAVFPEKSLEAVDCPAPSRSQTALFGDRGKKPGEVDLVLRS